MARCNCGGLLEEDLFLTLTNLPTSHTYTVYIYIYIIIYSNILHVDNYFQSSNTLDMHIAKYEKKTIHVITIYIPSASVMCLDVLAP